MQRIIGPIGTIGLVVLAFVIAPMLHGGLKKDNPIKEQVSEGIGSAKKAMQQEARKRTEPERGGSRQAFAQGSRGSGVAGRTRCR